MGRHGFTLIELLIVAGITVSLIALAVPTLTPLIRDQQISATQRELLASLRQARWQAINRPEAVIVCNGSPRAGCDRDNGWEDGWYVATVPRGATGCQDADSDGECDGHQGRILGRHEPIPNTLSLNGNGNRLISRVRFQGNGLAGGYAGTFSVCPPSGTDVTGSGIVINITGRMRRAAPNDLNC